MPNVPFRIVWSFTALNVCLWGCGAQVQGVDPTADAAESKKNGGGGPVPGGDRGMGTGGITATGGQGLGGSAGTGGQTGGARDTAAAAPQIDANGVGVAGDGRPPLPAKNDASPPVSIPDDGTAKAAQQAAVEKAFDINVLHKIDIVVAPADVKKIDAKSDVRVPSTVTVDGVTFANAGLRQSGGGFNPAKKINDKPSLSIKFNEFVKGQKLLGQIEKITLKNTLQDQSLMNEHLAYEVFRRGGLEGPHTAWAIVTINGLQSGIYVMREAIGTDFLIRVLGKGYEQGNLYENDYFNSGDFAQNPTKVDLKNEKEEGRSRADLIALATAVKAATATTFIANVEPLFDIDRYVTYRALETVTSIFDGFTYNNNNSYMYHDPKSNKFILFPHGADQAFWCPQTGQEINRILDPFLTDVRSTFGKRFSAVPALDIRFRAEVARVASPPVWDQSFLLGRVDHFAKLLATAPQDGRAARDIASFQKYRPTIETFIKAGGASKKNGVPATSP